MKTATIMLIRYLVLFGIFVLAVNSARNSPRYRNIRQLYGGQRRPQNSANRAPHTFRRQRQLTEGFKAARQTRTQTNRRNQSPNRKRPFAINSRARRPHPIQPSRPFTQQAKSTPEPPTQPFNDPSTLIVQPVYSTADNFRIAEKSFNHGQIEHEMSRWIPVISKERPQFEYNPQPSILNAEPSSSPDSLQKFNPSVAFPQVFNIQSTALEQKPVGPVYKTATPVQQTAKLAVAPVYKQLREDADSTTAPVEEAALLKTEDDLTINSVARDSQKESVNINSFYDDRSKETKKGRQYRFGPVHFDKTSLFSEVTPHKIKKSIADLGLSRGTDGVGELSRFSLFNNPGERQFLPSSPGVLKYKYKQLTEPEFIPEERKEKEDNDEKEENKEKTEKEEKTEKTEKYENKEEENTTKKYEPVKNQKIASYRWRPINPSFKTLSTEEAYNEDLVNSVKTSDNKYKNNNYNNNNNNDKISSKGTPELKYIKIEEPIATPEYTLYLEDAPDLETLDLYGGAGSEGPGETVTDPQSGFKPTLNYRFGGRGAPPEVSPPDYTYDNRLHTVEDIDGNTEKSVSYNYVSPEVPEVTEEKIVLDNDGFVEGNSVFEMEKEKNNVVDESSYWNGNPSQKGDTKVQNNNNSNNNPTYQPMSQRVNPFIKQVIRKNDDMTKNKQSSTAENIYLGAEPSFGPKTVSAKLAEVEIEPAHADMMMKIFKQNLGNEFTDTFGSINPADYPKINEDHKYKIVKDPEMRKYFDDLNDENLSQDIFRMSERINEYLSMPPSWLSEKHWR